MRWTLKRPWSDGTTALLFTPAELVERLAARCLRRGRTRCRTTGENLELPERRKPLGNQRFPRGRPKWSGWVYAYRTFWVDQGADWDEEKTAEFLHLGVSRER